MVSLRLSMFFAIAGCLHADAWLFCNLVAVKAVGHQTWRAGRSSIFYGKIIGLLWRLKGYHMIPLGGWLFGIWGDVGRERRSSQKRWFTLWYINLTMENHYMLNGKIVEHQRTKCPGSQCEKVLKRVIEQQHARGSWCYLKLYRKSWLKTWSCQVRAGLGLLKGYCWKHEGLAAHLWAHRGPETWCSHSGVYGVRTCWNVFSTMTYCSQTRSNRQFFRSEQACYFKQGALKWSGTAGSISSHGTCWFFLHPQAYNSTIFQLRLDVDPSKTCF